LPGAAQGCGAGRLLCSISRGCWRSRGEHVSIFTHCSEVLSRVGLFLDSIANRVWGAEGARIGGHSVHVSSEDLDKTAEGIELNQVLARGGRGELGVFENPGVLVEEMNGMQPGS
jgi:hypothetical protein